MLKAQVCISVNYRLLSVSNLNDLSRMRMLQRQSFQGKRPIS